VAVYPTVAPNTTLAAIQQKVRRLTRTPSEAQLTTDDLNNYINTFVVYDFPEILRTFNLRTEFTFYTNPGQDVYPTDIASLLGVTTNPLYDFQNKYITVHPPVYISGYNSLFSQDRQQFFGIYPIVRSIQKLNQTGDGVTVKFTGVIPSSQNNFTSTPVNNQSVYLLQNNVLFDSVDSNGNGLSMIDVPVMNTATGNPTINGNLYVPGTEPNVNNTNGNTILPTVIDPNNTINYFTGAFTVTFTAAPGPGITINSQTVPSIATIPQSLLFHNNEFTVRPVPDQPYPVNIEVYANPIRLLQTTSNPTLNEYWQFISFGCAKKIFEDRMDMDSVQLIMPEFRRQENLCLRRTIVQYTNERTATIYTEQANGVGGSGWGGGGPGWGGGY
jgi:hypothetical protein